MAEKVKNAEYDVCVAGGLGHVGLPLGLALADAGRRTVLFDINEEAGERVKSGEMPFMEKGAEEILRRTIGKNLFVSYSPEAVSRSSYMAVIIGTPVDRHLNPTFRSFKKFFEELIDYIPDGQHVILRSTVYPGATKKIYDFLISRGKKINISFCPERIAEGKAIEELKSLPQIVSAFTDEAYEEAREFFSPLTSEIIRLEPMEAELAKLITNAWRYITFAASNQFYQIAIEEGIDFYKIYDAITYKYPRLKGFPKAGFAAGPCLFKDTMQISAFANNSFFLGHSAMLINEGTPNFIVSKLKRERDLKNMTAGILGMAFKAESDDRRESLSYKLKKLLETETKAVYCSDPYVKDESLVSEEELIEKSDIIILGAPHKRYKDLEIGDDKITVDIWNFWGKGGLF